MGVLGKPLVKSHLKCRHAHPDMVCLLLNSYSSKTGLALASPTPSGTQGQGTSWSTGEASGAWNQSLAHGSLVTQVPKAWQVIRTHSSAEGWKLSQGFPNKGMLVCLLPMLTTLFPELLQTCLLINHKITLIMETKCHYQGLHVKQGVSYFTCIKLQPLPPNSSWHSV